MLTDTSRRRPGRRVPAFLAVAAIVLGTPGCTGTDSAPPEVRTTVDKLWTATGIDPVSAIKAVDGVAVVYGTIKDGLAIYGLDPATGTQLWTQRAGLPVADSDAIWVSDIKGTVAYFRPTGTDRLARLVLADPKTGADLAVSEPRYFSGGPVLCRDDDAAWVCLTSYVQAAGGHWDSREFRVNRKTGETRPADPTPTVDGEFAVALAGLNYSYPHGDDRLYLGRRFHRRLQWTKPATQVWGPRMVTPKYFWMWAPHGTAVTVITANSAGVKKAAGAQLNLAEDVVTAAVSLADGKVRWVEPGTSFGCGGAAHLGFDYATADAGVAAASAGPSAGNDQRDGYRCRYTGTAVRDQAALAGSEFSTKNLRVALERFDPVTGHARWSSDLGDARALASDTSHGGRLSLLDDTHLFVPNSAGGLVVDLDRGQTRPPTADDTFWCSDDRTFVSPDPYYVESARVSTANRSGVVHPCRSDGTEAAVPTTTIPSALSASFDGDRRVIALSDGVTGFVVPPVERAAGSASGSAAAAAAASASASASASSAGLAPSGSTDPASAGTPSSPGPLGTAISAAATIKPPAPTEPAPAPVQQAVEQAWATSGFEPRTTATVIGKTAVVYATVSSDLFLVGLDTATGRQRWRRPATAAAFDPDREVRVVEIDGLVGYLRDVGDDRLSRLAMIDPATGSDRIVTDKQWWRTLPEVCQDNAAYLCAWAYVLEPGRDVLVSRQFRVDRRTGAVTKVPGDGAGETGRTTTLWNDLVRVNGAKVETVGIEQDGRLLWSRPVTELFGPGASLDDWAASEDDGATPVLQLAGRVGWHGHGTSYPSLDLAANQVTVGVNRMTGSVLWRQRGTWPRCRGRLPDPGQMSTPGSDDPALRCRYQGRLDSSPRGRGYELTQPSDLAVTLERADLQTGKTLWSVPLAAEPSLAVDANGQSIGYLDDHRLLIGGQVVDVDNGSHRRPGAGETFWCPGPQSFDTGVNWMGQDGSIHTDRRVQGEVYQCTGAGDAAKGVPTAVPLAVSAVTGDGLRLVSTPNGVIAYRVPL